VYGKLGIKCWVCKGETKAPKPQTQQQNQSESLTTA
jgi:ribosomal protein S3